MGLSQEDRNRSRMSQLAYIILVVFSLDNINKKIQQDSLLSVTSTYHAYIHKTNKQSSHHLQVSFFHLQVNILFVTWKASTSIFLIRLYVVSRWL